MPESSATGSPIERLHRVRSMARTLVSPHCNPGVRHLDFWDDEGSEFHTEQRDYASARADGRRGD